MRESKPPLTFPKVSKPKVRVVLWEERRRPDGEALRAQLTDDGYQVLRWSSEPGQAYLPHAHIYPELLWLLEGSLTMVLPAYKRLLEITPGDRVDVPPGTVHGLLAGPDGAVYLIGTHF